MNIEQMTQKTREALQAAQRIAVEYSNNAVEQEHLLAALAQQQDGLIPQLLQTLGIDANAFAQAALQKGRGAAPCDRARAATRRRSTSPTIWTAPSTPPSSRPSR